jgi:hypothetical protein
LHLTKYLLKFHSFVEFKNEMLQSWHSHSSTTDDPSVAPQLFIMPVDCFSVPGVRPAGIIVELVWRRRERGRSVVNIIKLFSSSPTVGENALGCLSLVSLSKPI